MTSNAGPNITAAIEVDQSPRNREFLYCVENATVQQGYNSINKIITLSYRRTKGGAVPQKRLFFMHELAGGNSISTHLNIIKIYLLVKSLHSREDSTALYSTIKTKNIIY